MRRSRTASSCAALKSRQSASTIDPSIGAWSATSLRAGSGCFRGLRVRLGPGVRELIDLPQLLPGNPSVDLRRSQINVSQELLDGSQIRSSFQQVRRERVTERVRRGLPAGYDLPNVTRHERPNIPLSDPSPSEIEEQGSGGRCV